MNLTEFLLARIDEDESVARAAEARNGSAWVTDDLGHNGARIVGATEFGNPRSYRGDDSLWDDEGALGMFEETAAHIARHDPARVLAECEAKRRIVQEHREVDGRCHICAATAHDQWRRVRFPCFTLLFLALLYAGHPDYDEEWRP